MYIVLLRFSDNKAQASQFIQGHKQWIKQGLDDGLFLVVGSLKPNSGGAIVVHDTTLHDLEKRVMQDPFVAENVVSSEILEITPSAVDERLTFLL